MHGRNGRSGTSQVALPTHFCVLSAARYTQLKVFMQLIYSFAAGLLIATSNTPTDSARHGEDVAALIKRQSQEFSDASAAGDSAAFDRLLDDSVVFMNETGVIATKRDCSPVRGRRRPDSSRSSCRPTTRCSSTGTSP